MDFYKTHAAELTDIYNRMDTVAIHGSWLHRLPETPGLVCDIGAGSGRDANWFANSGWDVIAVEPCSEFRQLAQANSHPNVTWLDDKLPDLNRLRIAGHKFNLILLSAIWMHIPPKQRPRAFRIISDLLAPGGLLIISLRQGKDAKENEIREFYPVSAEELQALAQQRAIGLLQRTRQQDQLNRQQVDWETLVFQLPDDGTGSLPLLRHIIVNDSKAATYKLGLLRSLVRIAEGAPGMVINRSEDWVEVPFGLVGLYWLKLYMPLVLRHNIIQAPNANHHDQTGYGWANHHFWDLASLSVNDLRIGATFHGDIAKSVIGAINRACDNIAKMPAHYITWPGTSSQVFECDRRSMRTKTTFQIDRESLAGFGRFRIPVALWQSMGQYCCWLEPAIVNEWTQVMHSWNQLYDKTTYARALEWNGAVRDTKLARRCAERVRQDLHQKGSSLHCVWSNHRLRDKYEMDHCFPWSRWFNNDLWNLMPASIQINSNKSEKLPAAGIMRTAKNRILEWWEQAYLNDELHQRFFLEAAAALPMVDQHSHNLDLVFDAMLHQRASLKANQQLVEWCPS